MRAWKHAIPGANILILVQMNFSLHNIMLPIQYLVLKKNFTKRHFFAHERLKESPSNKITCPIKPTISTYSEVPNKSVTFFILFWDFFLPTWPY